MATKTIEDIRARLATSYGDAATSYERGAMMQDDIIALLALLESESGERVTLTAPSGMVLVLADVFEGMNREILTARERPPLDQVERSELEWLRSETPRLQKLVRNLEADAIARNRRIVSLESRHSLLRCVLEGSGVELKPDVQVKPVKRETCDRCDDLQLRVDALEPALVRACEKRLDPVLDGLEKSDNGK